VFDIGPDKEEVSSFSRFIAFQGIKTAISEGLPIKHEHLILQRRFL
jgi:hypothetical protein